LPGGRHRPAAGPESIEIREQEICLTRRKQPETPQTVANRNPMEPSVRTRPLTALVVTATAGLLASSALAAPTATTVDSVSRAGTTVTASGTALFDGLAPATSVGGTNTDFAQPAVSGAAGTDLKDALIETLPDAEGLRFTWKLASLPAQVLPEGVRYTWSFAVGNSRYQLQAKRTNVASITIPDDPAGHAAALAAGGFFQLRGNCTANYMDTPVANCPHIAFLKGAFNTAAGTVTMDVPFASQAAPDIKPGAVLVANDTAGMSISAAFQAFISNATISDFTNGWQPYYVGGQVAVATGLPTGKAETAKYTPAVVDADGAWTGTVTGVPANHTQLFVRSCEGATSACTYTGDPLG
jgi:hypothetical protein